MTRVKRGNVARQKRNKILNITKGFRGSLSKLIRPAKQAMVHALTNMYEHRRLRRRDFRSLWIVRINAALEKYNMSYSKFIGELHKKNVLLNCKILSEIAIKNSEVFKDIVDFVNKSDTCAKCIERV